MSIFFSFFPKAVIYFSLSTSDIISGAPLRKTMLKFFYTGLILYPFLVPLLIIFITLNKYLYLYFLFHIKYTKYPLTPHLSTKKIRARLSETVLLIMAKSWNPNIHIHSVVNCSVVMYFRNQGIWVYKTLFPL